MLKCPQVFVSVELKLLGGARSGPLLKVDPSCGLRSTRPVVCSTPWLEPPATYCAEHSQLGSTFCKCVPCCDGDGNQHTCDETLSLTRHTLERVTHPCHGSAILTEEAIPPLVIAGSLALGMALASRSPTQCSCSASFQANRLSPTGRP